MDRTTIHCFVAYSNFLHGLHSRQCTFSFSSQKFNFCTNGFDQCFMNAFSDLREFVCPKSYSFRPKTLFKMNARARFKVNRRWELEGLSQRPLVASGTPWGGFLRPSQFSVSRRAAAGRPELLANSGSGGVGASGEFKKNNSLPYGLPLPNMSGEFLKRSANICQHSAIFRYT